jgi:hypothetical protein
MHESLKMDAQGGKKEKSKGVQKSATRMNDEAQGRECRVKKEEEEEGRMFRSDGMKVK